MLYLHILVLFLLSQLNFVIVIISSTAFQYNLFGKDGVKFIFVPAKVVVCTVICSYYKATRIILNEDENVK